MTSVYNFIRYCYALNYFTIMTAQKKIIFITFESQREKKTVRDKTEKASFHPLVHSPVAYNSHGWARSKFSVLSVSHKSKHHLLPLQVCLSGKLEKKWRK